MPDNNDIEPDVQVMRRPKAKLSQKELEEFLSEMRHEPEWRDRANKCHAYYDGEQRDSRTLAVLKERGLPILIRNEIAPAVDILLGMEAKNKTRSKVVSDSKEKEAEDVARALTSELIKLERQTRTGRSCSDAYAEQVKAGLSWVEVAKEDNQFLGPVRVQHVNRKEIYWDWRSKRPDLLDARYLIRRQFIDKDVAKGMFPKQKELIEHTLSSWSNWDAWETSINHQYLASCYDLETSRTTIPQDEWISTDRHRVCVYEVWYRIYENILVFTDSAGIVREFNKDNQLHVMMVATGMAELTKSLSSKVRIAWWIGPHLVSDKPSPYNHNFYPYVPFWGFRDDANRMPYALVSRMISPQDEINARLSKQMDILSSKRVIADSDAFALNFNNFAKVREQVASANSFIITNPNRKNVDGIKVETDIQLNDRQFEMMNSASTSLKEISGINAQMTGQGSDAASSGIAVNALIEQGNTGTAELSDNFRYARTLVSELELAAIKADIGKTTKAVPLDYEEDAGDGKDLEIVDLNKPAVDEFGMEYISNSVMHSRTEVEIEDIPSHQSVKQQQFTDMLDFTKLLPPEYMGAVAPFLVMTSDLEFKNEIAEAFRQMNGTSSEEQTPEQAEAAAKQEEMDQLAMDKERALVEKEQATVGKLKAETVGSNIESTYSSVQSAGALAQQPQLIPTADSLLQSAGFEDANEYPVAEVPQQPVSMTDGVVPPEQALPAAPANGTANTSPMFPPVPESPAKGAKDGIETQTVKDNNNA